MHSSGILRCANGQSNPDVSRQINFLIFSCLNIHVPCWLDIWALEDKAIMLSRNVGTRLHIDTVPYWGKKSVYENDEKETSHE